jgi:putative spermidine/putrescine transport system substrate-binding protein
MSFRLAAATAALAVLGLAGVPPAPAHAAPAGEIVLMGYSGAYQDNYTKAVIEPFEAKFPGVKVVYAAGGNSAQMLGQIRAQKASPQIDVSIIDFSLSRVANAEGLFAPLDRAGVPALADMFDQARMGTAPGGEWGPGVDFDHLVLLWGDTAKPAPKGIADLMDPANKGKIVFSPAPNIIGASVQILAAKYLGQDYKGPLDPVMGVLKRIGANVQTWQATPDNYTMIINGAAGIGVGWNARAQYYADKSGGKVKSAVFTEGGVLDMDTINLVAGSHNQEAAKAFINYALSPEPQVAFARLMYYGPTNSRAQLPPDLLARTSSAPETLAKMIPVDWDFVAKALDGWTARWRREVIPAQ